MYYFIDMWESYFLYTIDVGQIDQAKKQYQNIPQNRQKRFFVTHRLALCIARLTTNLRFEIGQRFLL